MAASQAEKTPSPAQGTGAQLGALHRPTQLLGQSEEGQPGTGVFREG